jgi:hypothetical protein
MMRLTVSRIFCENGAHSAERGDQARGARFLEEFEMMRLTVSRIFLREWRPLGGAGQLAHGTRFLEAFE